MADDEVDTYLYGAQRTAFSFALLHLLTVLLQ